MIEDLVDSASLESGQLTLSQLALSLGQFVLGLKAHLAGVLAAERVLVEASEGMPRAWPPHG
jgi:hypothetical protein